MDLDMVLFDIQLSFHLFMIGFGSVAIDCLMDVIISEVNTVQSINHGIDGRNHISPFSIKGQSFQI